MKNRISLIIVSIILIFAIGITCYWMSEIQSKEVMIATENATMIVPTKLINSNITPEKIPSAELLKQLNNFSMQHHDFGVHKWEFGPNSDEITLYAYAIKNESLIQNLQGAYVNSYKIRIIHDTEFERTQQKVVRNLTLLQQDSRYQIDHFYTIVDPFGDHPEYTAELWVNGLTPENRKLDNTKINEWRIVVYPMSPYPLTQDAP